MFDRRLPLILLFKPGSDIFPRRDRLPFFYQYRWIIFFCRVGLMFSLRNYWEHASFGRIQMSVELAQKNVADLHCKFFMQHQNKKTSSAVKKHIIVLRAFFKKNCAMSAEKYQSGLFQDRCRLLSFLFNPWMKYAWSLLANIYLWGGLIFSWLNKCEHASFGRNKTSVEIAQKNLAGLHCKFFMQHQNKKTSSAVKKTL